MHPLQLALLRLSRKKNLGAMTLRQIGEEVGEKFPQKVKHHLDQLHKKGLIRINKDKSLIEPVERGQTDYTNLYSVPILGAANAGPATVFAEESLQGYLKVSEQLLPPKNRGDLYAVKVTGSSMNLADVNGKHIDDGDYILVDPTNRNPPSGDYVLSVIDGAANVKKMIKEPGRIVLMSESYEDYAPIVVHPEDVETYNYLICGTVVDVVKQPRPR